MVDLNIFYCLLCWTNIIYRKINNTATPVPLYRWLVALVIPLFRSVIGPRDPSPAL